MTGWCGVEIWGWIERERMERLEERYLRWVMGLDSRTPDYMVKEELHRGKLKGRAGSRAWVFERRLREGKGGELARRCWEEMREILVKDKEMYGWEEERRSFFESRGVKLEEVVERGKEEGEWFARIEQKDIEEQRRGRWEKLNQSRYNKCKII